MLSLKSMKSSTVFLGCIFLLGVSFVPAAFAESVSLSKEEALKLLSSVAYTSQHTNEEWAVYQKLLTYGDQAFPVLTEILLETHDDFIISRIMKTFVESKGDKSIAVNAISDFLDQRELKTNMDANAYTEAMETIGKLGGGQRQINQLLQILEHKNNGDSGLQYIALRNLAIIGDKRTSDIISRWLATYEKSPRTVYYEMLTTEANKTMAQIQERIGKQQIQSPTDNRSNVSVATNHQIHEQKHVVELTDQSNYTWQLPLLISVLVISGLAGVWLYCKK